MQKENRSHTHTQPSLWLPVRESTDRGETCLRGRLQRARPHREILLGVPGLLQQSGKPSAS